MSNAFLSRCDQCVLLSFATFPPVIAVAMPLTVSVLLAELSIRESSNFDSTSEGIPFRGPRSSNGLQLIPLPLFFASPLNVSKLTEAAELLVNIASGYFPGGCSTRK